MKRHATALLPINKGDSFILKATNEHYVCLGWRNGYLRAGFHNARGIFVCSMTVDFLLHCGYEPFPKAKPLHLH